MAEILLSSLLLTPKTTTTRFPARYRCHSRRLRSSESRKRSFNTGRPPALTDSLPFSCMPFARRDSVFDLLSISSMIPWMWSPEIPWKSMAPGPGRNLQLPASVLQPTTSIYCTAALRPAPLSASTVGSEAQREAQGTGAAATQPQRLRLRSPPRHSAKATGRKGGRKKKKKSYSMGGTGGGGGVVCVVHQLSLLLPVKCLSSRKKDRNHNNNKKM